MEGCGMEREHSALGGLFNQIVTDMKNGTPLWEDLVVKATKLHSCLRATLNAISSYLDAFQKIADAATNTRGATKEIGTALTRICLRHKAVEARMKTFTSAIMDCLVVPLQEKLEDWKKVLINLDKEHSRDYKRARTELKKRSTDTLRLQKKVKKGSKGSDLQRRVECSLQDMNERKQVLEDIEKKAVRSALIEERSRYCLLVAFLKPVVDEEVAMLSELSHLQEVVDQLEKHTSDPHSLPPASEQVISDLKSSEGWTFQTPPSSPGSLGSRKSSMCSISSLNSSSSGSSKSHHSPSHPYWHRSLSQVPSAFEQSSGSNVSTPCGSAGSVNTTGTNPTATWPNLQETLQFERAATAIMNERPHTISTAYEKGHQRPSLTVYTFHAPESSLSQPSSPVPTEASGSATPIASPQPSTISSRPPIPNRCSSLERPSLPSSKTRPHNASITQSVLQHAGIETSQPMYVNMHELASLAASKAQEMNFPPPPPPSQEAPAEANKKNEKNDTNEKDGSTSESSLESSSGYGSQIIQSATQEDNSQNEIYSTGSLRNSLLRRSSVQGQKPPPPIRRTSSISMSIRNSQANYGIFSPENSGSNESLPPPPAYLLESSYTESSKTNSLELSSKKASEYQRTAAMGIAAELQRKTVQLTMKEKRLPSDIKNQSCGISVAETVRTLTELNHTPASPVSIRRTHSMRSQSADRKIEPSLIAALSAKLAPGRRHSQEMTYAKASRVRQWIAVRTLPDPTVCHDSLMDQIKKGTSLRKTRTVNDRSAPRIH
ncbi:MTSS1-like protein isoform X2 [Cimex lectularius]|uniref:Uncharacterized protein n=1 Tax=Cimex lectularius TaxID=79782 RepID=A0A8I6RZW0_CIMLE|nr:MTSS1-like protein isoform X2 [Cimex lectularius]